MSDDTTRTPEGWQAIQEELDHLAEVEERAGEIAAMFSRCLKWVPKRRPREGAARDAARREIDAVVAQADLLRRYDGERRAIRRQIDELVGAFKQPDGKARPAQVVVVPVAPPDPGDLPHEGTHYQEHDHTEHGEDQDA